MGAVNLPNNVQDGDDLLAAPVMADFQAITQVVNGNLEANSNVAAATAVTQPGSANAEGVAATLARSDHKHLMQGFENLAADPTTGNFKGRVYWNTVSSELRYCTDATGSGTFGALTPTATELVVHAAQHKDGGHDPLADNTITDHMLAAKTNIFSATLGSDHASISTSAYSTILDLTTIVTTGVQTLHVIVALRFVNTGSNKPNVAIRVLDQTAAGVTIWRSQAHQLGTSGSGNDAPYLSYGFFYTVPATGARTLRLQAGCDASGGVDVKSNAAGFNGDTTNVIPTIQAVII